MSSGDPADDDGSTFGNIGAGSASTSEPVRRSNRQAQPPEEGWRTDTAVLTNQKAMITSAKNVPISYKMADIGADSGFWKQAVDSELFSLEQHNTWTLVPRSEARNTLTSKWVFVQKQATDDKVGLTIVRKARLVASGFRHVQGVDYEEKLALVVKVTSIRLLLAHVAHQDLELHRMDVKTTFLNGELEEDIYMEIQDGVKCGQSEDFVCKLNKSLYGIKQASLCWN